MGGGPRGAVVCALARAKRAGSHGHVSMSTPSRRQMQAVRWIKAREGRALEGKVKTFGDPDFLKQLELAITYGAAFLFENCDEYIDSVIDPVLERALTPAAGGRMVRRQGASARVVGGGGWLGTPCRPIPSTHLDDLQRAACQSPLFRLPPICRP